MKNYKLDLDRQRIQFIDTRFYLSPKENYLPSVTTILEAYPKDASYYKWLKDVGSDADHIRDEAGRRGSVVHELTEKYDCNEEISLINDYGTPQYKMIEWSMFERYVEFSTTYKPTIDMMEVHLMSDKLGFAGTLDRVIRLGSLTMLLDIKTSNSIYPSYWLQLAAYHQLLKEHHKKLNVDSVGILWLNAKTRTNGKGGAIQGLGWQLVTRTMTELKKDWELFKSTQKLWLAMNDGVTPRNISYQLKYKKDDSIC
jgi:hypothetical protein